MDQAQEPEDMLFSSSDWNQAMLLHEHRDQHLQQAQQHLLSPPSVSWSFTPPASPGCSNRKFPTGLAQKIGYLQMVIQMLGNNNNNNNNSSSSSSSPRSMSSIHHEQIGQLVDQLLVAARGMFLEQQQQQPSSAQLENEFTSVALPPVAAFPETVYQQPRFQHHPEGGSVHAILPKSEPWTSPPETSFQSVFGAGGVPAELEEEDVLEAALPRDSYELIELDAMEILAEHTHFCEICGKGFKRDANLRMHMRGHGDEYKTPAALARPKVSEAAEMVKKPSAQRVLTKRYSCPYVGCKRNKQHKKFVPLKTVLCVKNHYRRSHCPKLLMCTRCRVKRFAVLADLKTHEKHCGREKWQCSCGTTFSRKDKLLGHIALFVGHKPMMMLVNPACAHPPVILPSSSSSSGSFQTELPPLAVFGLDQLGYSSSPNTTNSAVNNNSVNQLEVDVASSSGGGACWSPESIFAAAAMGNNNSGGHAAQESNTSSTGGGDSNGPLGFLGLDFFDCKG